MARPRPGKLPDLSRLAEPGTAITVRVTPKAARDALLCDETGIRAMVTAAPERGRANAAVRALLARAMGVAPTHLELRRGETARNKTFVYVGP